MHIANGRKGESCYRKKEGRRNEGNDGRELLQLREVEVAVAAAGETEEKREEQCVTVLQ